MHCPFCHHEDTLVKDTRPAEAGTAVNRRRSCPNCGQKFTTVERIRLRELFVLKAGGAKEPFRREKLERSVQIALRKRSVGHEQFEQIISAIVLKLEAIGKTDISSKQIGQEVMEALKNIDEVAYVRFASVYKDFRGAEDFQDFIKTLNEITTHHDH